METLQHDGEMPATGWAAAGVCCFQLHAFSPGGSAEVQAVHSARHIGRGFYCCGNPRLMGRSPHMDGATHNRYAS